MKSTSASIARDPGGVKGNNELRAVVAAFVLLLAASLGPAVGEDYVPPPVPVAADLAVGSYYFPGHFSPARWAPFRRSGFPTPLLGFYRDGEPEVMDWHIKWAVEHGLSYFVFDWYYDWRSGTSLAHNAALDEGFLRARYRDQMRFALMWCNEGPEDVGYGEEDMLRLARVLTERYFRQPNYLRIRGDNVLVISIPDRVVSAFGAAGAARVFEKMAAISRAAGCGGLYPVAKQHTGQAVLRRAGYRATTGYNYPTAGMAEEELWRRRAPYASMVRGYERIWREATRRGNLPYVVPVSPGWDSRPWHLGDALVRTGSTGRLFERMCRRARRYVHPELRMVLSECWNEFGEGSYIEPTREHGFDFLDALRRAFCPGAGRHADVVPEQLGRSVPVFALDEVPVATVEELMAAGENMLPDGGVETGWLWRLFSGSPTLRSPEGHSGRWSLRVAETGVKADWLMPLPPGRRVVVRYWARVPGGAVLRMMPALFRNGTWLRRYADATETGPTGGTWHEVRCELRVTDPEATQLDVEFVARGGECLVDDISVTAAGIGNDEPRVLVRRPTQERLLAWGDTGPGSGWLFYDGRPAPPEGEGRRGGRALLLHPGTGVKTAACAPIPATRRVRLQLWWRAPAGARLEMASAMMLNGIWLGRYSRYGQVRSRGRGWRRADVTLTIEDPVARELNVEFVAHGGPCLVEGVLLTEAGQKGGQE